MLEARTQDGTLLQLPATECCLQNERDDTVDDLVKSDFLHEPGWVCRGGGRGLMAGVTVQRKHGAAEGIQQCRIAVALAALGRWFSALL